MSNQAKQKHGNIGNANAKKQSAKSEQINIRVNQGKKAAWKSAAAAAGLPLSAWIVAQIEGH